MDLITFMLFTIILIFLTVINIVLQIIVNMIFIKLWLHKETIENFKINNKKEIENYED